MATASLTSALLVRKGTAKPGALLPADFSAQNGPAYAAEQSWSNPKPRPTNTERATPPLRAVCEANEPVKKTMRKSVTIEANTDKDLRVLAAAKGISQQQLIAEILSTHLKHIYREKGCVCGAQQ